jgi:hypothetical protein
MLHHTRVNADAPCVRHVIPLAGSTKSLIEIKQIVNEQMRIKKKGDCGNTAIAFNEILYKSET